MKVLTVLGARPQFIKAWVVSPRLRERAKEVLVHTGQHFDPAMSQVFFDQLRLPPPDYHFHIESRRPAAQLAQMLAALDPVIEREAPDVVLVYGDTTSTLAGALAAAKSGVPVAHVEAGLRSGNLAMPEESHRIVADHLAARRYCPTLRAVQNLARENLVEGVLFTGDVMAEALAMIPRDERVLQAMGLSPGRYAVMTVHRQENADRRPRLAAILEAVRRLPEPIVWPVHPRTRQRLAQWGWQDRLPPCVQVVEPLDYRAMISLIAEAQYVLTDSGGLQREAAFLGIPCYVLRDETEWVELVDAQRTVLVGVDPDRIVRAVETQAAKPVREVFRDRPSQIIVDDLCHTWGGT